MNLQYWIIIAMGVLVASSFALILAEPEQVPYVSHLEKINQ